MSVVDDGPRRDRRRRRSVLIGVFAGAVVAAAVASIVAITRYHDDPGYQGIPTPVGPQPDLRWTMDPLPAGWAASGPSEMSPTAFSLSWNAVGNFWMSAYGTHDDPLAPVLVVGVGDELNDSDMGDTIGDLHRLSQDGTVGLCGTSTFGWQRCIVTRDGHRLQSHSRGLSFEQLRTALAAVELVDHAPQVPANALPQGMALLGSWHNQVPGVISTAEHPDAAAAAIAFGGTDGRAVLQVGRADQQDLAFAFETGAEHSREVDGVTYYEAELASGFLRTVAWERDGRTFELVVTAAAGRDPVDLARSLRPATAAEWAAAATVQLPQLDRSATPSTQPPPETTWPSLPEVGPTAASLVDVPVTDAVEMRPDGGFVVHAALPGGDDVPLTVLATPDHEAIAIDGGDFMLYGVGTTSSATLEIVDDGRWSGAFVFTDDARVAALQVVRTNGDRYVVDLVPVPGSGGHRVAYVAVPAGERWNAEIVDQFGKVLDLIGQNVL